MRERDTQTSHDVRQATLDILSVSKVDRRARGELVEDRPQLDLFVEPLELIDASGRRRITTPYDNRTGGVSGHGRLIDPGYSELVEALGQ